MLIASLDLELRLYSEQRSAEAAPKKLAQAEQQRLSSSCWLFERTARVTEVEESRYAK
jgi:hypothetical protein